MNNDILVSAYSTPPNIGAEPEEEPHIEMENVTPEMALTVLKALDFPDHYFHRLLEFHRCKGEIYMEWPDGVAVGYDAYNATCFDGKWGVLSISGDQKLEVGMWPNG